MTEKSFKPLVKKLLVSLISQQAKLYLRQERLHCLLNRRTADRTVPESGGTVAARRQVAAGHKDNVGLPVVADPAEALLAESRVLPQ